MGYNYNGKLKSAELLLKEDGSVQMIRRAETPKDYLLHLISAIFLRMSETCKKQTADLDRRGGQQLKTERRYLALERVECRLFFMC